MRRWPIVLIAVVLCVPAMAQDPCYVCSYDVNGDNWINTCIPGIDHIPNSTVTVGANVQVGENCDKDTELSFEGPLVIERADPAGTGVISMEIVEMHLAGPGGITLIAGPELDVAWAPDLRSLGTITQVDPQNADSFFDVYFQIDLGGGLVGYNRAGDPLQLSAVGHTCVPPDVSFEPLADACVPVYASPIDDGSDPIGHVTFLGGVAGEPVFEHDIYTAPTIPTVSAWGLLSLTLLVLAAGTVVLRRGRALAT